MSAPYLVLAHGFDAGAAAVAARLRAAAGEAAVLQVAPEQLALARWSQRIDARGGASTRIRLPDGRTIDSGDTRLAWNRIRYLWPPQFRHAAPKDADYATQELQALVASWLWALGARALPDLRRLPCVTPVVPRLEWSAAAAECGLALSSQASGDTWVLVAGERALGARSAPLAQRCVALARRLGFGLIEFVFENQRGDDRLAGANPWPALRAPAQADAAAELLHRIAAGRGTA